jgi:hypothetical protein
MLLERLLDPEQLADAAPARTAGKPPRRRPTADAGDRAQQQKLLAALKAGGGSLRRDECGAWCIHGTAGRIYTWGDGQSWVLVVESDHGRTWEAAKRKLAFCPVTQDGDTDGCLHLRQLPTARQAADIREVLGIRKRRQDSETTLARLRAGSGLLRVQNPG